MAKSALSMNNSKKLLALVPERLGGNGAPLTYRESSYVCWDMDRMGLSQRHSRSPMSPCNDSLAARCPKLQLNAMASSKEAEERVAINNHNNLIRSVSVSKGFCHSSSMFMKAGIFFLSPKELAFHTSLFNQEVDKVESPYIV